MGQQVRFMQAWFGLVLGLTGLVDAASDFFVFRDLAPKQGLTAIDKAISTHALAWGDADGDGHIDLFIGSMVKGSEHAGSALLWNNQGRFALDTKNDIDAPRYRAAGSVFVDLDNDGLLELYISTHAKKPQSPHHFNGHPNLLYWARPGRVYDRVIGSGATPHGLIGRSVGVLDYNGDGLLDLFIPTAPKKGQRARLFRNRGGLKFDTANAAAGLPDEIFGLGVAVQDLTGNGWPDFFVGGSNRLFLNRGDGTFREATELKSLRNVGYAREGQTPSCGVAFGDINRDGKPDLVIGTHPKWPWSKDPAPVRLFLNKGVTIDKASFVDVTRQAALPPKIWMKAPHVEIRDFDNDGWPDILTSVIVHENGQVYPLIFKNMGTEKSGVPRFKQTAFRHQPDFPTAEDRALPKRDFYKAVPGNLRVWYCPQSPSGDFNNDGRLDLFLSRGWPKTPCRLLRNETPVAGRHWLAVKVAGSKGVNKQGIGAVVNVYRTGGLGQADALLYREEIGSGFGYGSGQPAMAHIGLGEETICDVEVILPHGKGKIVRKGVKADRSLVLSR